MSLPSRFRTSSFCLDGGCVAVARSADGRVEVASTLDTAATPIAFTPAEWDAFVAGVKAGEFDSQVLHP
ncbi:DUF397 domain-containing protein [Pseudonocardia sp. ICBG1293]|uniref:DUF397 domain-containing protein n=1 Tax=Pseudonocardia sp. ICBG1293 TaxID=2844382 RepID=UPI001CCF7FF1|nr:DUF397 domain-containing protein [Pseudonocardia sp. ICBG1293]